MGVGWDGGGGLGGGLIADPISFQNNSVPSSSGYSMVFVQVESGPVRLTKPLARLFQDGTSASAHSSLRTAPESLMLFCFERLHVSVPMPVR